MSDIQLSSANTIAQRLQMLAQLYRQGQASDLMERTLDKLLVYEAKACRVQLGQLQKDLAEFEQRYGLSSTEFYRRFQAGQTDDRMDYIEWASLVQMVHNLRERLDLLTGRVQAMTIVEYLDSIKDRLSTDQPASIFNVLDEVAQLLASFTSPG